MEIRLPDNPYLGCLFCSIIVYTLIFFVGYLFEIFGFLVLIPLALAYCAFYVYKNIEEHKRKIELQKFCIVEAWFLLQIIMKIFDIGLRQ